MKLLFKQKFFASRSLYTFHKSSAHIKSHFSHKFSKKGLDFFLGFDIISLFVAKAEQR